MRGGIVRSCRRCVEAALEANVGVIGLVVSDAEWPRLCNLPWGVEADRAAARAPWLAEDLILGRRKPFCRLDGLAARVFQFWPASSYLIEAGYPAPSIDEAHARVAATDVG